MNTNEPENLAARCERLEAENARAKAVIKLAEQALAERGCELKEITRYLASTTPNPLYAAAPEMRKALLKIAERPMVQSDSFTFEDAIAEVNSMITVARTATQS